MNANLVGSNPLTPEQLKKAYATRESTKIGDAIIFKNLDGSVESVGRLYSHLPDSLLVSMIKPNGRLTLSGWLHVEKIDQNNPYYTKLERMEESELINRGVVYKKGLEEKPSIFGQYQQHPFFDVGI